MRIESEIREQHLQRNQLSSTHIQNLKLDYNKNYLVTTTYDMLPGKLLSQHNHVFIFECINKRKQKKRVCINKVDYILNRSLIKEC